jgi:GT2 family glycosyltransferase
MAVDVSVIFVNYNTVSLLINAIDSVLEKTIDIKYELIVVDNASKDNSERILLEKYQNKISYISLLENVGFGRANNEGMKIAKGRNIFLLNPDVLLQNNAIKLLSNYLDNNVEVGVVGGNLFYEDGSPQTSYSLVYPSIGFELINMLHLFSLFKRDNFNDTFSPKEVKIVVGAALMIKREVINSVGGFDPSFFMYSEEDEWCFRIHRAGYKLVNLPQSKITHLEGKSFEFSEDRQKRKLEGIRNFYKVSYSKRYCYFVELICKITICIRFFIFYLLNNKQKMRYWNFMFNNRNWIS